jgi:Tfp pilus assembly protein PilX
MRRLLHRLRSEESGIALIMALGTIVVLSILVVSVIDYSATNSRESSLSSYRQRAYTLAEAGLNDGLSVLEVAQTPLFAALLPSHTTTYDGGSVTWSGTLDQTQPQTACPGHIACWIITSTGSVRNPAGGSKIQTRTLTI